MTLMKVIHQQRFNYFFIRRMREAISITPVWHVARNTIILLVSTLAINAISIPFLAFLARTLGTEGFGAYSVAFTFAHIFVMVIDMGAGKLLTREISRCEADGPVVVGALVTPKPLLFAIALVAGMIIAQALGYSGSQATAIKLSIGVAAMMTMAITARSVFHAYQRMEYDIIGMASERIVTIAGAVMAVKLGYGVLGVLVAVLIGNLTDALLGWLLVRRHFVSSFSIPDRMRVWNYLQMGFPLFLAGLFSTLYLRGNIVILDRMLDSSSAGWYNAAFQLFVLALYVPQMLGLAIFPVLSRLACQDEHTLNTILRRGTWAMALGGALFAVCIALVAAWLVPLLYSNQFIPSVVVLRILVIGLPFTFVSSLLVQVLVATNRQSVIGRAMIVAAATNVALNLALVRIFGVNGAAYAAVITEMILLTQYALAVAQPRLTNRDSSKKLC